MKKQKEKTSNMININVAKKHDNGITLIALVITIIVLLILAGITISALTGGNGILFQAGTAKEKQELAEIIENIRIDIAGVQTENEGSISEKELNDILSKYGEISESGEEKILTTSKGVIKVSDIWNGTTLDKGVSISEIFDSTGEIEEKLHIGDFINYTAGTWTKEEIEAIGANNSTSLPQNAYQFGGFVEGSSRDSNATAYRATDFNYNKDAITGEEIAGWRLFDVMDDGTVILISAGCPEDYYQPEGKAEYGYITQFILTNTINSYADASDIGLGTTYKARDWSMYVNSKYNAISATTLTKERLDEWFVKYTEQPNSVSGYSNLSNTQFESLININVYYWLCTAFRDTGGIYFVDANSMGARNNFANGFRVLVSLSPEVKFSNESSGTKTVISKEKEYTYNVWDIEI